MTEPSDVARATTDSSGESATDWTQVPKGKSATFRLSPVKKSY